MQPLPERRGHARNWGRIGRVLAWAALTGIALLAVGVIALRSQTGRGYLAIKLSELLSKMLVGEIRIGSVRAFTGSWVVLGDVVVRDGAGRVVVRAARVEATLDLAALMDGNVILDRVTVEAPWVSLHRHGPTLAIAEVFLPVGPSEPKPEDSKGQSTFLFEIRHARLRRGSAVELPGALGAERVDAHGTLSYSDAFRLQLSFARGQLRHAGGAQVDLQVKKAALRVAAHETSYLEGSGRLGTDTLQLALATSWGEHGPATSDARITGTVSPAGLATAGLTRLSALLSAPLTLHAEGQYRKALESWALRCDLYTAGGQIALDAQQAGEESRAHVHARELSLARVLTIPEVAATSFDLALQARQVGNGRQLVLRAEQLSYGARQFPAWTAHGTLDDSGAHLSALDIPSWRAQRGELQIDVEVERNGDAHGSLSARLPRMTRESRLGRLSGARADALRLSANATYRAASDALEGEASGQLASLTSGDMFVGALRARVRVRGTAGQPKIAGEAELSGLRLGTLRIDRGQISATGGPVHYRLTANASAGKALARAELTLSATAREQRISGSGEISHWLPQPINFRIDDLSIRPDAIAIGALRASAGTSLLAIEGSYGRTRSSDLHIRLEELTLQIPVRAGRAPAVQAQGSAHGPEDALALRGHVGAHLHFQGSLAEPVLQLSLHVPDLALSGAALGRLALAASLDERGIFLGQLSLNGSDERSLQLSLDAKLPSQGALPARLKGAHYALSARGSEDVSKLAQLVLSGQSTAPAALDAQGAITFSAHVQGSLAEPLGALSISGTGLQLGATGPFDARADAEFSAEHSKLALAVRDRRGLLAQLDASLAAGLLALSSELPERGLAHMSASYQLKVSERELADLPAPLARNEPWAVALNADLSTFPDRSPRGQVTLEARSTDRDRPCPQVALPRLTLRAELQEGRIAANAQGQLGSQRVLNATLTGPAPLLASSAELRAKDGYALAVDLAQIDLAQLPMTCGAFRGRLSAALRAERLLAAHPRLDGQLSLKGLQVRDAAALDLALTARGDDAGLHVSSAEVRSGARRTLSAEAHLPWHWDGRDKFTPDPAHCRAQARLSDLELDALLALVPSIAQPTGRVSGELSLQGCTDLAGLRGNLSADQVSMTLRSPLLRVDDLVAKLSVSQDAITLESLRVSDQGGSLRGRGKIQLSRGVPTRAELAMTAEEFPLRSDAKVAAHLDGKLSVSAQWDEVPRRVKLTLADVSFLLPTQRAQKAQDIARHVDIVYVDSRANGSASREATEPSLPIELRIESEQPFWVRRDDFGVQLETHLRLAVGPEGPRVSGPVLVRRGFINLLSKGFDIERGELLFDGEERPDPTVTIDAVHKLGDGQTVTVRIRERLSAPVVTFATSVAGIATDAEIMQLLMRGRESSATQTAQAQVGAALASMTSQLVGSLGRTKLGKYVPVLALEAGASSGTRIRAGVEANALIPAKLRTVVEGAYMEGFVGGKNQGGNAQATGGVLMELYFPKKLVTGGTWELPNNWSLELTWEP